MKLDCPHCGKKAISFMRKMCMGPAVAAKCKNCSEKVGVTYADAMLAAAPMFISLAAINFLNSLSVQIFLLGIGFIAMSVLHMNFVPLQKRK